MSWAAALHGFFLAIGLILPIGMQNGFLLFQGALHTKWRNTLPTIITAGLSDTTLIGLGVMGVSTAALKIVWLRYLIGLIGILFLLYMGWSTWHDPGSETEDRSSTAWPPRRQIGFTLSVSLLNPHALIDTLAVIGGSATVYITLTERIAFWAACAMVSWVWFFTLTLVGHWAGRLAFNNTQQIINRISAILMWGSALFLGSLIYSFGK